MRTKSNTNILIILLLTFFNYQLFAQMFVEQAIEIGIDHAYKARDLTGGGAAFFDYDNDGDEDLYITAGLSKDYFYVNNGDGTFTKMLSDIGFNTLTQQYNTTGVTTGDIDNDGDRDVFVTTWERFDGANKPDGRSLLFLNDGDGAFSEIGVSAGITHEAFAMGAIFLDYDRDGLLDIYVMNHIKNVAFTQDSTGAINGYAHDCSPNFFYRNNGNLTFSELAADYGMDNEGCTIAAIPTDYDMDGDLDVYIANDFGGYIIPNALYENQFPDYNFEDVSEATNSDVGIFGMGIASGDYDHDQDLDYYVTNIGRNVLIENQDGIFDDVTTAAGVENTEVINEGLTTGWGTAFLDVDNDTWEDLFVSNGRIPAIAAFPTAMNDPHKLYMNNGDKTFEDVSTMAGVADPRYGRGMAYSDYDMDGDLDMIVVTLDEFGGKTRFYVNETNNDNNYVQIKLKGKASNKDAFGSKIWLYAGDEILLREIYGGGVSHASQHTSIAHFGLGDIETIDSIRIEWINGHIDSYSDIEINNLYIFEEDVETSTNEYLSILSKIQITPNPFDTDITVSLESSINQSSLIRLLSTNGKVLWLNQYEHSNGVFNIDLDTDLPDGLYFLQIQIGKELVTRKLVKD